MLNRVQSIVLIGLTALLAACLFSYSSADPPDSLQIPTPENYQNWGGKYGAYLASWLFNAVGYSAYLLLASFIVFIVYHWYEKKMDQIFVRLIGLVLIFVGTDGLASVHFTGKWDGPMIGPGGYLGVTVHYFLNAYFAPIGVTILFSCCLLSGLVLACDYSIIRIGLWLFGLYPFGNDTEPKTFRREKRLVLKTDISRRPRSILPEKNQNAEIDEINDEKEEPEEISPKTITIADEDTNGYSSGYEEDENDNEEDESEEEEDEINETPEKKTSGNSLTNHQTVPTPHETVLQSPPYSPKQTPTYEDQGDEEEDDDAAESDYELPSLDLLLEGENLDKGQQERDARRQGKLLEEAFSNFGVNVNVVNVQCGPVIAQFEIQLERGVQLKKIHGLTDDLAVAMGGAESVRIVAPLPGKNTVGVELPNPQRQKVRLREVIEKTPDKIKAKMAVPIFLGQDVVGEPLVIDLAKMPHLLIAGQTGSGKSVCLNSIIVSILMTRTPEECRMILIDPKMVELSPYQSIPHLMHPVVTDMKKAEAILGWVVEKMEQRYQILANARVRQLSEYNALTEEELYNRVKPQSDEEWENTPRSMPYLVIVADEMADMMMTAAKEVEDHIIRLAQKSRAVGIHLVLATQKPTVDVITGLIKSNLPARLAFQVASRTDSQVILDAIGADKLLGHGDMLFLKPGTSQLVRGQGILVENAEIDDVIESVATDTPDYVKELVELKTEGGASSMLTDPRDELFNEVVEYVLREGKGKASISLIQRKFKIGYQRSARIVDFMYDDGIVGEPNGSHPRDVIMTLQQWRSRLAEMEPVLTASNNAAEKQPSARQQSEKQPHSERFSSPQTSAEHRIAEDTQIRRHQGHATGRSTPPNIAPNLVPVAVPQMPQKPPKPSRIEAGVGPVIPVDDSMLTEIKPNTKKPLKNEEEFEILHLSHKNLNPISKAVNNPFGVVPITDSDVIDNTDTEGDEWEYEYVYEEVDADEENNDEYDGEEEDEDSVADVNMQYPDEVDIKSGGDWESEEDWEEETDEEWENEDWEEDEYEEED
ncbi:MAG: DNA translocase FtsK [Planctomycetaceae bacterium]|nr:DNA translocase FtsK [Planctomycetaceae bacterium]